MWSMTIENSANALILLRVTTLEQPSQDRVFKHGVIQQFVPRKNDGFLVGALNVSAKIESVDWTIIDEGRLIPLVKASVHVLNMDRARVKSLLDAGWEEHKPIKRGW